MQQVQCESVGSPRGDLWEKQRLVCVLRAARVRRRLMSMKRQIEPSGNPGAQTLSRMALLVCICLLDWESTGLLFPPSFQRADLGPGAEPWPCLLTMSGQRVTADSQGLSRRGKGRKAKQLPPHASSVLHMPNNLRNPTSGLCYTL